MTKAIHDQQMDLYSSYEKLAADPRFRKMWPFLHEHYPDGARLLDIGCADGHFCRPLIGVGRWTCYGVDLLFDNAARCQKEGMLAVQSTFLDPLPFADESFDVVVAGEVVEHVTDERRFLREVHRVLKGGTRLILTTPNLVSLGNRLLMLLGRMPRFAFSEFHYRMWNLDVMGRRLREAGFDVEHVDSNYVGISRVFNGPLGRIGEMFGRLYPRWGENLIIYSRKMGPQEVPGCNDRSLIGAE